MRRSTGRSVVVAIGVAVVAVSMLSPVWAGTVPGGFDLELTKSVSDAQAERGDTLTYTLVATNFGELEVADGIVQDFLPSEVTFVSVDDPACALALGVVKCSYSPWPPITTDPVGAVKTIHITVTVNADAIGPLENTARALADGIAGSLPPEADLSNNLDTATTVVVIPPDPGSIGDRVWDDLDGDGVQDVGEPGLAGVTVDLVGPSGPLSAVTDGSGLYLFSGLMPGDYTVSVDVSSLPAGYGLTTPGSVSHSLLAGETFLGADFGAWVPPPGIIDLSLTKTVSETAPVDEGTTGIEFTVTVTNDGPDPATGVVVTDTFPAGLTFVEATGDGSYLGGTWTVGNLAVGQTKTLIIEADAPVAGSYTNIAEVTAADQDDSDSTPGDGEGDDFDSATLQVVPPPLSTGQIGDTVFLDKNGNKVQDSGEGGISGVVVTLTGPNGTQTRTTGTNGKYLFSGLFAGTHTVKVSNDGAGPKLGLTTPGTITITLSDADSINLTADFGFTEVLPKTGLDLDQLSLLGLALLLMGAALVRRGDHRRGVLAAPISVGSVPPAGGVGNVRSERHLGMLVYGAAALVVGVRWLRGRS